MKFGNIRDEDIFMHLEFGTDDDGTSTYVEIAVGQEHSVVALYLLSQGGRGMIVWQIPEDGGSGEELPVPTISQAELLKMASATEVVQ